MFYCVHFVPLLCIIGNCRFIETWIRCIDNTALSSLLLLPHSICYPMLAHALLCQFCAFYIYLCLCCGSFCLCIFVCISGNPLSAGPSPYCCLAGQRLCSALATPSPYWLHGHNGLSIPIHSPPWASHFDSIGILKNTPATQSPKVTAIATCKQKVSQLKFTNQ